MPDREQLNEAADQTYDAADIADCEKPDGSGDHWTREDFQDKVNRDGKLHENDAEEHLETCQENDNGDNDWDKVNHFSAMAVAEANREK